jgi:hypothetical protein
MSTATGLCRKRVGLSRICSTEGQGVFAVRWTDSKLPQGGGVMRIRIRTYDKWSIGRNSLDYRRLWDIVHDH